MDVVRALYLGNDLTNVQISARYGKAPNWVNHLAAKHGWPLRGRAWKPGMDRSTPVTKYTDEQKKAAHGEGMVGAWRYRKSAKRGVFALAQLAADNRLAESQADGRLYGALLPDVMLLRRRDFVVTREKGGFRVGNRLLDEAGVIAVAERERRVAGIAAGHEAKAAAPARNPLIPNPKGLES